MLTMIEQKDKTIHLLEKALETVNWTERKDERGLTSFVTRRKFKFYMKHVNNLIKRAIA